MKVSRTQVATEVVEHLNDVNRTTVIDQAAAWLVSSGKQRQAKYLADDIARILATQQGYVLTKITTARPLDDKQMKSLEAYVLSLSGGNHVEFIVYVDPKVIGGVRIETPIGTLDETVQSRLRKLARGTHE
jgi:F0F1-type ATP synthase delta subunit